MGSSPQSHSKKMFSFLNSSPFMNAAGTSVGKGWQRNKLASYLAGLSEVAWKIDTKTNTLKGSPESTLCTGIHWPVGCINIGKLRNIQELWVSLFQFFCKCKSSSIKVFKNQTIQNQKWYRMFLFRGDTNRRRAPVPWDRRPWDRRLWDWRPWDWRPWDQRPQWLPPRGWQPHPGPGPRILRTQG